MPATNRALCDTPPPEARSSTKRAMTRSTGPTAAEPPATPDAGSCDPLIDQATVAPLLKCAIDALDAHTVILDNTGHIVTANQAWLDFAAANEGRINIGPGADYLDVCDRASDVSEEAEAVGAAIRAVIAGDARPAPVEYPCHTPFARHWFLCSVRGFGDGDRRFAVVSHINITDRKRVEQQLRIAAATDRLTELPNRDQMQHRLQAAIDRAAADPAHRFAVMFLDFDRFKIINDSLGHEVGDDLLRDIARRLREAVGFHRRPDDSVDSVGSAEPVVARFGGDEFVVLLEDITDRAAAVERAERLLEALNGPYQLDAYEVHVTASIGIVLNDSAPPTVDELLSDADTAMYEAKCAGPGRHVVFDRPMRQRVRQRMRLENDLRGALKADQLFLEYQPIVGLADGDLVSVEALVRWQHPEHGRVSPGAFIPVAEETGLIVPIGQWVLRTACEQFMDWRRELGAGAPRGISVNLSRVQLLLPSTVQTIRRIIQETGITPEQLQLEVTESTVMEDPQTMFELLEELGELGVRLAIDDFGTGYSSLACLHDFRCDVLKIDRSFINKLHRGRGYVAMVRAVLELAEHLSIEVVAEGIETPEQAALLQSLDCAYGQGFLFSRPMPPGDVARFRSGPTPPAIAPPPTV